MADSNSGVRDADISRADFEIRPIQRGNPSIFMRRSRVTEQATHVRPLIRSNSDEKREFVSLPRADAVGSARLMSCAFIRFRAQMVHD